MKIRKKNLHVLKRMVTVNEETQALVNLANGPNIRMASKIDCTDLMASLRLTLIMVMIMVGGVHMLIIGKMENAVRVSPYQSLNSMLQNHNKR